jgi:hypothetical protein
MHTQTTSKEVLVMGNLLLNSLAFHHSHTFRDLQKEHPRQVDLLVSKNNVGETVTAHKQPIGTSKNSKQNASYLLAIMTRLVKRAGSNQPASQKISKQNASYLLAIRIRPAIGARGAYNLEHPIRHR